MVLQHGVGEQLCRAFVRLLTERFHALPRYEQRRPDDQHHRHAEQKLAFGGERDFEPTDRR
ncbi:MAG: hypothetical protein QM754_17115 [Tepidisphaeraceae bacterium]